MEKYLHNIDELRRCAWNQLKDLNCDFLWFRHLITAAIFKNQICGFGSRISCAVT
jgi:hypothetical protein